MKRMQRTSPATVLLFAVVGLAAGLLIQFTRSGMGRPPLVPPVSLAATLIVIAAVLIVLAALLHRAVRPADPEGERRPPKKPINPFHAVRLLAGARASQFAGALFGGFGGGLALQLLGRSVPPPSDTWLPMLLVLASGVVLAVCGMVAEWMCRVPPEGPDASDGAGGSDAGSPTEHPA